MEIAYVECIPCIRESVNAGGVHILRYKVLYQHGVGLNVGV